MNITQTIRNYLLLRIGITAFCFFAYNTTTLANESQKDPLKPQSSDTSYELHLYRTAFNVIKCRFEPAIDEATLCLKMLVRSSTDDHERFGSFYESEISTLRNILKSHCLCREFVIKLRTERTANAKMALAALLYNDGKFNEALKVCDEALALAPNAQYILINRVAISLKLGYLKKAKASLLALPRKKAIMCLSNLDSYKFDTERENLIKLLQSLNISHKQFKRIHNATIRPKHKKTQDSPELKQLRIILKHFHLPLFYVDLTEIRHNALKRMAMSLKTTGTYDRKIIFDESSILSLQALPETLILLSKYSQWSDLETILNSSDSFFEFTILSNRPYDTSYEKSWKNLYEHVLKIRDRDNRFLWLLRIATLNPNYEQQRQSFNENLKKFINNNFKSNKIRLECLGLLISYNVRKVPSELRDEFFQKYPERLFRPGWSEYTYLSAFDEHMSFLLDSARIPEIAELFPKMERIRSCFEDYPCCFDEKVYRYYFQRIRPLPLDDLTTLYNLYRTSCFRRSCIKNGYYDNIFKSLRLYLSRKVEIQYGHR